MKDNLPVNSPLFPSKANILTQLTSFCASPEIVSFLYYSGHGTSIRDVNGDESKNIIGGSNMAIQRSSKNSANGQFNDSCIVTNEGSSFGLLIDDDINECFKKLPSKKRVYAFFDSCNSGTIIDLYAVYFADPKNMSKFSSQTVPALLTEMKKPENATNILTAYFPKKLNEVKGIIVLFSGTRDNTSSYEGLNLGTMSGNLTSRLCWLLSNGVGKMSISDFYLALVGLLNNPEQIPVLSCSKCISLTKTTMYDFDISKQIDDTPIPFIMSTPDANPAKNLICDSNTEYNTLDDEMTIIDQITDSIGSLVTDIDTEIKTQLATVGAQVEEKANELGTVGEHFTAQINEQTNSIATVGQEFTSQLEDQATTISNAGHEAFDQVVTSGHQEFDQAVNQAVEEVNSINTAGEQLTLQVEEQARAFFAVDAINATILQIENQIINSCSAINLKANKMAKIAKQKVSQVHVPVIRAEQPAEQPADNTCVEENKANTNKVLLSVANAKKYQYKSSANNVTVSNVNDSTPSNKSSQVSGAQYINYLMIKKQ